MTLPDVSEVSEHPLPQAFSTCRGCEDKIRVIDAIRAQEREVREELRDVRDQLMIADAKLSEARRALDYYMGMRS